MKLVALETHIEHSNEGSLQQPHQDVAPVVLVIRDSGVTHIHREGHQEELDGGPEESGPLSWKSCLHVKLEGWGEKGQKRERSVFTDILLYHWKKKRCQNYFLVALKIFTP